MTPQISDLISKLVQEYAKETNYNVDYTGTYDKELIFDCIRMVEDWMIFQHCDKDREAMDRRNRWIEKNVDDLAEEEQESKDAQVKDIPWNRIMMNSRVTKSNKEWEFWPKNRKKS